MNRPLAQLLTSTADGLRLYREDPWYHQVASMVALAEERGEDTAELIVSCLTIAADTMRLWREREVQRLRLEVRPTIIPAP